MPVQALFERSMAGGDMNEALTWERRSRGRALTELHRDFNMESRPNLGLAVDPYLAAHQLYELAADRQAQAGASKATSSRLISLCKGCKGLGQCLGIHPGAGIRDRQA